MKITKEVSCVDFEAWSGGADTLNTIKENGKCKEFDDIIDEHYPDGLTDTHLNDILWFESEWIFELLGIRESDEDEEVEESEEKWSELSTDERTEALKEYVSESVTEEMYDDVIKSIGDIDAIVDNDLSDLDMALYGINRDIGYFEDWFKENK